MSTSNGTAVVARTAGATSTAAFLSNEQIAIEWRAIVESPHAWTRAENQAGGSPGEASGYYVSSDTFARRCYLKPGTDKGDQRSHARGAREKIASDLAYDVGLPVPPAVLTRKHDAPGSCAPAVLLVMYPLQWQWDLVKKHDVDASPKGVALAGVLGACSPMFAFDTWVGQTDHGDHPSNIVWGYDPKNLVDSKVIFLDYANALGFNGAWTKDTWQTITPAPWPPKLVSHCNRVALGTAIEKINALSEDKIRDVVNRVHDDFMDSAQRAVVADALVGRRAGLAKALNSYLGSSP